MVRTQIQITAEQARGLKRLAATEEVSMAELIRRAIDSWLDARRQSSRDDVRQRARAAAGRLSADVPDLSTGHDDHLAAALGDRS